MKLKIITAVFLSVIMALSLTACIGGNNDGVYAQSVAAINNMGAVGVNDRFPGVTVSGKTTEIKLDQNLTLEKIMVEEGQIVKKGDVLFTYNNDSAQLSVDEAKLEIESLKNRIASLESQISELTRDRDAAASSDKLGYTLEIQSAQADIREANYNISVKEKELKKLEETVKDTQVKSELDGRITEINRPSTNGDYYDYDNQKAFMTIVEIGNLRVKGTINEMNRGALYEGQAVTVRSRTDTSLTWTGEVLTIDWEKPETGSSNEMMYYGYMSDEMTTSSKYPFYISLDDTDGLIIGQHVYIEPGVAETPDDGELRIPDYYICDADSSPWVWAVSSGDRLEKREISISNYDEDTCEYVIESGLTAEDYIAFPEEGLKAGQRAVKTDDVFFGADDGEYIDGAEYYGNEEYDGEAEYYEDENVIEQNDAVTAQFSYSESATIAR